MTFPRRRTAVTHLAALALLATACGGGGEPTDPQGADDATSSVTTTDPDDEPPASSVISKTGQLPTSEVEVRVAEIISEFDGVETTEGTHLTIPSEVLFDLDEDRLRSDAEAALDEIVEVLEFYADAPVEVVGHTDSQGSASYNQGLSERRAAAVARYLQDRGIGGDRLSVAGRGETDPVASNDAEEGRQQNRRVEVVVRGVAPPDLD